MRYIKSFVFLSLFLFSMFSFAATNDLQMLLHDKSTPFAGNPNGKAVIVEFFDYQCSHCIAMAPVIAEVIQKNPEVKVVFKDFPIRGPISELAAKATLAANMQGKYYQLNHALLSTSVPLSEATILSTAQQVGLNINKLKTDMKSAFIRDQIKSNEDLAERLKLPGTPAFFIANKDATSMQNVNYVLGAMTVEQLQTAIAKALNNN